MRRDCGIGDSDSYRLEKLTGGNDLGAARDRLQPLSGSRHGRRGKNLARQVRGSDACAYLNIAGNRRQVKHSAGKPVDVGSGSGGAQGSRALHDLIIHRRLPAAADPFVST